MSNKKICVVAIETSCDDTCVSIIKNAKILSNITMSSNEQHKKYGGIVPEIAARSHEQNIAQCYKKALLLAHIKQQEITHIAYTDNPGLPGSLHIGKVFAKSLASLLNAKLIPVNHMLGHIYSFCIDDIKLVNFPFISLVASGGHTSIYLVKNINNYQMINETNDDAIGEALDKVGRLLKMDYPGGISIDKCYDSNKTNVKMINHFPATSPFSFSGIKTHVLNLVNQSKMKNKKIDKVAIASSLLKWIVEEILIKLNYYTNKYPNVKFISIGGGFSANTLLRKEIQTLSKKVLIPKKAYTTDNAAMIATYAYLKLIKVC